MYFDETLPGGGGEGPVCSACREPIARDQRVVRVRFASDPQGHKGLSGSYHVACSKPFASLAHALDATSRFGW